MLPNVLIIGSQKSSSTMLQSALAAHPDCYTEHAENQFFEEHAYNPNRIDELAAKFPSEDVPVRVLKRPTYYTRPGVPSRVKKHIPNAKLILVLRDPLSRAVSAYYHYIRYNLIPHMNITDGFQWLLDCYEKDPTSVASEILEYGLYHKYYQEWMKYFDAKDILIFKSEDFNRSPEQSYKKLFDFVGVKACEVPKLNVKQKNIGLYNWGPLCLARMASFIKLNKHCGGRYTTRSKCSLVTSPLWYPVERAAFIVDSLMKRECVPSVVYEQLKMFYREDALKMRNETGVNFNIC